MEYISVETFPMVSNEQFLRKVPIFSDLTDKEIQLVAVSGIRRKYPPKNMVFQQGESGDHLLIILVGKVQVFLSGKSGREFILSVLGPGEFFGEMAILESAPRSASVMTVEPCEFFLLSQKNLATLLQQYPSIAMKILKNLSYRLRKTNDQVRNLVMFDIYSRIGSCLLNLADKQGVKDTGQLIVSERPSIQEIAKMVGCSRETLSRALKILKGNGCLTVTRKTIYINKVWE